MILRRHFILSTPLLLPLVLDGCAAGPKPAASLALKVIGGPDQNPDNAGPAAPVSIEIFQLSDSGAFNAATPLALLSNARGLLGSTLTAPMGQLIVAPEQHVTVDRKLAPTTQFIGIAVFFRQIEQAQWRVVLPVKAHRVNRAVLRISGIKAMLSKR